MKACSGIAVFNSSIQCAIAALPRRHAALNIILATVFLEERSLWPEIAGPCCAEPTLIFNADIFDRSMAAASSLAGA
jgi:hypothetical protein